MLHVLSTKVSSFLRVLLCSICHIEFEWQSLSALFGRLESDPTLQPCLVLSQMMCFEAMIHLWSIFANGTLLHLERLNYLLIVHMNHTCLLGIVVRLFLSHLEAVYHNKFTCHTIEK